MVTFKKFGKELVLKKSGDELFLSSRPSKPASERQLEQREKFKQAVNVCKAESKKRDNNVFSISPYNKCIAKNLKGESKLEKA